MKERQDRIDFNSVSDLENDRKQMIAFLEDECTYDELVIMRKHYEKLIDHRILKLESSLWLILLWREIYKRESKIMDQARRSEDRE
tara:strand:+ start:581 stop:838 length:258 start_codon:yes stop_codon:yes gene_type:complete